MERRATSPEIMSATRRRMLLSLCATASLFAVLQISGKQDRSLLYHFSIDRNRHADNVMRATVNEMELAADFGSE
jgi:hypothetical protein